MGGLPTGFYRLPSGRIQWRVSIDGIAYNGSAKTLGEARRARAQAELTAGTKPTGDPTVADVVDAYLADVELARGTREDLVRVAEKLPPAFLVRQAAAVTPVVVAALWRELAATCSRHRILRARDLLSQAWQLAITWEWVTINPFKLVPPPRPAPADEIHPPDPATVNALIAAAGDRPLALWLRLAAVIGARRGELCALQWGDVRLDRAEIVIRRSVTAHAGGELEHGATKTSEKGHRVVPIDLPTVATLRAHRTVGCPWVFTHDRTNPWRPGYVTLEVARLGERLGFDDIHPHVLRHFAATQWLAAGVPIPTVAYLLGHTNPATTLRVYAHFIPAQARDAIVAHAAALDAR